MNAVAYCRYSSDNQRAESIDAQIRAIKEYCERENINLIKIYKDEGLTATSDDRPDFLKMIEDSQNQNFEAVIVHKLDRFSRDRYDSAIYKKKLKNNGIKVISVLENLSDDPESIILESVLEGMAEYYSKNLARETKKGQNENALKCLWNGGTPPLGYDVDKNLKLVINESEAEAVKLIFEMFANKKSYSEIIKALNLNGYKTKRNNNIFGKNSLHEILKNKKYIGIYEFGKINKLTNNKNEYKSQRKESNNYVSIENGCPAIISKDLWESARANARIREPSKRAKSIYLLKNKIYCKLCNSLYVGSATRSHQQYDNYYICSGRKKKNGCINRNIRKTVIENTVKEEIKNKVLNDKGIEDFLKAIKNYNEAQRNSLQKIKALEKEKINLNNKMDRIKNAYYDGIIKIEELKKENNLAEEKKNYINQQIKHLQPIIYNENEVKKILKNLMSEISNEEKIINCLIDKIEINQENIEVHLFSCYGQG